MDGLHGGLPQQRESRSVGALRPASAPGARQSFYADTGSLDRSIDQTNCVPVLRGACCPSWRRRDRCCRAGVPVIGPERSLSWWLSSWWL
jgi:hypothetical protein